MASDHARCSAGANGGWTGSSALPRARTLAFLVCTLALVLAAAQLAGAAPRAQAPAPAPRRPVPAGVSAKAGGTGTLATVRWKPVPGALQYRVWRSTRSLAAFEPVGSTTATSFADRDGLPNRTYYYQVTAMLENGAESRPSTPTPGVTPDWNQSPHATYGKGNLCLTCHAQHRVDGGVTGGEIAICYSCHDGQGAQTNVQDGPDDSFALASGHRIEEASRSADLTNECSSCHSPHADPRKRPSLYAKRIKNAAVSGGNAWCGSCHDDASSWSPRYPATGAPTRDASGYPVLGTYPGPTVYAESAGSGHAGISGMGGGPKGDCLLCHAAHRGPNAYDGLLLQFRPSSPSSVASDQAEGTYAQLCLNCHSGGSTWPKKGAADIGRYVTRRGSGGYAGHTIVTSGGTLPPGAPLPCYDCHNPHGSSRGNASLISDALGRGLSTENAADVRAFCLSCHTTGDGRVWDSVAAGYSAVGSDTVEGLRRDSGDRSLLRLSSVSGHLAGSSQSCYACHGSDYESAGGYNVHAPERKPVPILAPAKFELPAETRTQDKTATAVPAPVR